MSICVLSKGGHACPCQCHNHGGVGGQKSAPLPRASCWPSAAKRLGSSCWTEGQRACRSREVGDEEISERERERDQCSPSISPVRQSTFPPSIVSTPSVHVRGYTPPAGRRFPYCSVFAGEECPLCRLTICSPHTISKRPAEDVCARTHTNTRASLHSSNACNQLAPAGMRGTITRSLPEAGWLPL